MFTEYKLTLMVDRLVAGLPASERMVQAWLDAKAERMNRSYASAGAGQIEAVPADKSEAEAAHKARLAELREQSENAHLVVFGRENGRPYLEGRCIKALFKEAANVLKDSQLGIKNARSKLAERVFVVERFILFTAEVHRDERPISVMTMQGPRTSIKAFEYAENVELECTLKVLDDGLFGRDQLEILLEYSSLDGVGADRSQGNGTFTWSLH